MSNNGLSQFLVHVECLNLFRRVIGQLKFAEQFNRKSRRQCADWVAQSTFLTCDCVPVARYRQVDFLQLRTAGYHRRFPWVSKYPKRETCDWLLQCDLETFGEPTPIELLDRWLGWLTIEMVELKCWFIQGRRVSPHRGVPYSDSSLSYTYLPFSFLAQSIHRFVCGF